LLPIFQRPLLKDTRELDPPC